VKVTSFQPESDGCSVNSRSASSRWDLAGSTKMSAYVCKDEQIQRSKSPCGCTSRASQCVIRCVCLFVLALYVFGLSFKFHIFGCDLSSATIVSNFFSQSSGSTLCYARKGRIVSRDGELIIPVLQGSDMSHRAAQHDFSSTFRQDDKTRQL